MSVTLNLTNNGKTVSLNLHNGRKGEAFKYEDFTPEQLEALKLKFEDLSPEDKEELALKFEDLTPEQVLSLKGEDGYTPVKGVDYFDGSDAEVTAENIEGALGGVPVKKGDIPFEFTGATNFVSKTTDDPVSWRYEAKVFSGWGCGIGPREDFNVIKLNIRQDDPTNNPITSIRVRVRENDRSGIILTEKAFAFSEVADGILTASFDDTVSTDSPLWIEYLTDGTLGNLSNRINRDVGQGSTSIAHATHKDPGGIITSEVSVDKQNLIYAEFLLEILETKLTPEGISTFKNQLTTTPAINLPEKIYAVVGYTQQLFYRGMIKAINPYQWNIKITGASGKQYPRYYEFTPSATGIETLTISLYNENEFLVASASTVIETINPITSPASVKNVLCVGDSLTAAGKWTEEMQRMLAGTGGTPTALGLSNIELIGTQGTAPNLYEGYGGWSWATYVGSSSPFWNSATGEIDFANYVTVNGFGAIDYSLILLTWNQLNVETNIFNAKTFLDKLITDFPNVKVKLLGVQLPSVNGGLAANYDDDDSAYGNYLDLVKYVFELNDAYEALSKETGYSSFVSFENVSAQFDNENNMPEVLTPVNLRSSKTEYRGTNGVHPKTEGYYQIADVAFRAFNSF